ncbi:fungal specific transcription factor domain-containing protein [Aspergillus novofumigatus IBT 16806]|uniref:Xylanolytic transcriptional activator regulatory domain-containing protein n=1 Tax=Aspergillus novofumigatus (strain IBT 16806) TaxID=1392255 RepID=A0A2I1BTU3_ASPN1|nr:uncharacterized protein P174DRAFT_464999 [Aspergillus novofumigatus IBT 16806]PKX88820.1 hypothetical protein P174DRAFT_464999 [Aspergillus novofumigatus IBT 16806]
MNSSRSTIKEVYNRLEQVEKKVNLILSAILPSGDGGEPTESEASSVATESDNLGCTETGPISTARGQQPGHIQLPTFTGETSIGYALNQVTSNLEKMRDKFSIMNTPPPPQMSTPALTPTPDKDDLWVNKDIRSFLRNHDIEPNRPQWDNLLTVFCNEVHIMYPFLHLPTLWDRYRSFVDACSPEPTNPSVLNQRDDQVSISQIMMCLAIGRCTESLRINSEDRHSAGWSLYAAAMDLFGDVLSIFAECSDHLLVLQALALAVVYLFRLDITAKAEKLLALAISHAYNIGLHRAKVVNNTLSVFEAEMCRRLWWSLFILDRRLAIDTSRPFLIQDLNVDTPLPQDLDNSWLLHHREDLAIRQHVAPQPEKALNNITPIPYLQAMVTYSRVLGKVWEAIYSDPEMNSAPSRPLYEPLEYILFLAQKDIRSEFAYNGSGQWRTQFSSSPWWLVKQQVLMRMRWLSLHLLIRKPMLQGRASLRASGLDAEKNDVTCMQIAIRIIEECGYLLEEKATYAFPFFHYLLSATIVSLGLIIKEPTFKVSYGPTTLQAAQILKSYCRKTWVSGKLIRSVLRLSQMALQVLDCPKSFSCRDPHAPQKKPQSIERPGTPLHRLYGEDSDQNLRHLSDQQFVPTQGPGRNKDMDPNCPTISNAPPPYTESTGLGNLVVTDFDFKESSQPASPCEITAQFRASANLTQSSDNDTARTGEILLDRSSMATYQVSTGARADTGECVAGDMEWLEALFGNYLDSNLIIREHD